jgi:hypothetical protein
LGTLDNELDYNSCKKIIMSLLKKILIIFFLLFYFTSSFAAMVTFNQRTTVNTKGTGGSGTGSDDGDYGLAAGIEFNKDGTKMFVSYAQVDATETVPRHIVTFNLSTPYDISTKTFAGDSERCVFNLDTGDQGQQLYDLEITSDGMKILVVSRRNVANRDFDKAYVLNLTSPYDISSCTRASATNDLDHNDFQNGSLAGDRTDNNTGRSNNLVEGIEINNDGTKLFLMYRDNNGSDGVGGRLLEYNLSTPYDLSETSLSLVTSAGIKLTENDLTGAHGPTSLRFRPDGKRLFIVNHAHGGTSRILQISLTNAFDTSSFVIDGSFDIDNLSAYSNSQPRGIAFSSNGLKMYVTKDRSTNPNAGLDQVIEYDLVCPFNIIAGKCPSITENNDRHSIALAQIEIAKRTIDHSTDTALNRLKWIRRNKDKQNLSNLNLDINFTNQRLASLTEIVKTSAAKKKAKEKNKKEDIFYWSEGSIAIGRIGDTSISSTKKIDTDAITFGADRFTDENGIKGLAFRLGRNNVDVGTAGSYLDTDTFNITYYATTPIEDDTKFLDSIIGIGKLNSDLLTVLDGKKLNADRSGHQLYGTIRIKDEIKKNNLTFIPSGRFDIGHTILGSYKESGNGAIDVQKQHIRSKKIRLGISAVEDISNDKYDIKRHGKIEYVADIDRSSNLKYTYVGDGSLGFNDTLHSEAIHNINGEIGIDIVLPNRFSIFLIYERNQALGVGHTDNLHIAIGYLPNKNTNYSIFLDGTDDTKTNYVISKNINDFLIDFKLTSHLMRPEEYEEASFNLRRKF